jgi:hypothetical protein
VRAAQRLFERRADDRRHGTPYYYNTILYVAA